LSEHRHEHHECGEMYWNYKYKMNLSMYGYPKRGSHKILLCPLGESFSEDLGRRFLAHLQPYCVAFYSDFEVEVLPRPLSLTGQKGRRNEHGHPQYLISDIHKMLNKDKEVVARQGVFCRLGITLEDIYQEDDVDDVLGEADAVKRVGVFSLARQSPLWYKGVHASSGAVRKLSPTEEMVWIRNGQNTMVHEIGHILGMTHCAFFHCLMNGYGGRSESAGASFLCPVCLRKVLRCQRELQDRPPSLRMLDARYAGLEDRLRTLAEEYCLNTSKLATASGRAGSRRPSRGDRRKEDVAKGADALGRDMDWLALRRRQLADLMAFAGEGKLPETSLSSSSSSSETDEEEEEEKNEDKTLEYVKSTLELDDEDVRQTISSLQKLFDEKDGKGQGKGRPGFNGAKAAATPSRKQRKRRISSSSRQKLGTVCD